MAAVHCCLLLVVSLCACSCKPMYCGIMTVAVVLELHVLVDQGQFMWFAIQHSVHMVFWFGFTVMYCVHRNTGSAWWIGV